MECPVRILLLKTQQCEILFVCSWLGSLGYCIYGRFPHCFVDDFASTTETNQQHPLTTLTSYIAHVQHTTTWCNINGLIYYCFSTKRESRVSIVFVVIYPNIFVREKERGIEKHLKRGNLKLIWNRIYDIESCHHKGGRVMDIVDVIVIAGSPHYHFVLQLWFRFWLWFWLPLTWMFVWFFLSLISESVARWCVSTSIPYIWI